MGGVSEAAADPILTEVLRHWFSATADEMSVALVHSSYSTRAKESQDASTALFDARGRLIAQASGTMLMHVASLRECLSELLRDIPAAAIEAGDAYIMNDPYRGGIHANDIAVFSPAVVDGEVRYFAGAIMHVADLGGTAAGGLAAQATEIYHEGLLLPPVQFVRDGEVDHAIARIVAMNSRTPEKVLGDLSAMLGATQLGVNRMAELLERYDEEIVESTIVDLLDYTERRTRLCIAQLPEGRFTAEFTIDDDGIDVTRPYTVRVAVERHGSTLSIDLTGTDAQAGGPINASYSQALSGVIYGARCLIDPTLPMNEGCLRPLEVVLPHGTLVNPSPPAPLNARVVTVTAVIEALLDILHQQRPECGVAASSVNHVLGVSGCEPGSSTPWHVMISDFGGVGARNGLDGIDASGAYFFGGRATVVQLEAIESEYPVLFEHYALLRDSGGAGRWRGGLGVSCAMRALTGAEITVRADRMRYPPIGRAGGLPGVGGSWIVNEGQPDERRLANKQMGVTLAAGDVITMRTSGGGGFGAPEGSAA